MVSRKAKPRDDDDDAGESGVPVETKEPKEVGSDSLQTPHDPDVTYSGHKGKGYEVQVTETCHAENVVEPITHVELTESCKSDTDATLAMIEELQVRGQQPAELKRQHGLGTLRVRGQPRVELAMYLKALSCYVKRMLRVLLAEMTQAEVVSG